MKKVKKTVARKKKIHIFTVRLRETGVGNGSEKRL